MTIARDHLGRDRVGFQAQPFARDALDLGIDLRVRAHRSGELPDAIRLEGARDAAPCAVELERPAGELPAKSGRLRVNAMRAADADGVPVLLRSCDDCRKRAVDPFEDQTPGILDLQ